MEGLIATALGINTGLLLAIFYVLVTERRD